MKTKRLIILLLPVFLWAIAACTALEEGSSTIPVYGQGGNDPDNPPSRGAGQEGLRVVVLDHHIGDLHDPAEMAKYSRAELIITQPSRFWHNDRADDIELIRAANPNVKIVGFFRSKCVRLSWANYDPESKGYEYELYKAAEPFFSYTTTGDTLQDWPKVAVFNYMDPAARRAMLDVFSKYQNSSSAKLDGVYWDYFGDSLWISGDVNTMTGEPDMDNNGVVHWDDPAERNAFTAAQDEWVAEMRQAHGEEFIQIANGGRALRDSTFAGLFDGLFYEIFPNVGFSGNAKYAAALDPSKSNNLFTSRDWMRTQNGGPWMILSNVWTLGVTDHNSQHRELNLGDINRVVALLTDGACVHYDLSGRHHAGRPLVEVDLGQPLGGVTISGDEYYREFERGHVKMTMGSGAQPIPFSYEIIQNNNVVQMLDLPYMYP